MQLSKQKHHVSIKTTMAYWTEENVTGSGSKGGVVVRVLASHQCGPSLNPGVDVICGLSLLLVLTTLLWEVFLRVLQFSPLLKNQHFQIPIQSGMQGHVSTSSYEFLRASWVNKLQNYKLHWRIIASWHTSNIPSLLNQNLLCTKGIFLTR